MLGGYISDLDAEDVVEPVERCRRPAERVRPLGF
jgi:hypothetical protein